MRAVRVSSLTFALRRRVPLSRPPFGMNPDPRAGEHVIWSILIDHVVVRSSVVAQMASKVYTSGVHNWRWPTECTQSK